MSEALYSPKGIYTMLLNTLEEVREKELQISRDISQDALVRAEARGTSSAYYALAQVIRDRYLPDLEQAENQALEAQQRSLHLRQNCVQLATMYRELWDFLVACFGSAPTEQLAMTDPVLGFILLNENVLSAIIREVTPEQHPDTEVLLQRMSDFLEQFKAGALSGVGNAGGTVQ